jgi:hypothetical protein
VSGADPLFAFSQFEFPWSLGPADGRYVMRDGPGAPPGQVLVLRTLGAPERRRLRDRRPRGADPEPPPTPVPTTRATVIAADRLGGEAAAEQWLSRARGEPEERLAEGLAAVNRALQAHAVAAGDPLVREVARDHALVARLGWGRGDQVADGRWTEAVEVPPPRVRSRRVEALRPQERLAALLGARDRPLAAELLAQRARLDLDQGRDREAALQLRVGLEAGIAELEPDRGLRGVAERVDALNEQRGPVGDAANAALRGPLDEPTRAVVQEALRRLEAALRARTVAALDRLGQGPSAD